MTRSTYLATTQIDLLRDWGHTLYREFGEMPYLVGSALARPDWRDVDVRIIVAGAPGWFGPRLTDRRGHLLLSLWGREVTGLPIDCQFQTVHEADTYPGRREPLALRQANAATTR